MRISDWSSDVCSSDLIEAEALEQPQGAGGETVAADLVAGQRGLVHDGDAPPGARQRDRRSRTRRSPTHGGDLAGVRSRHQDRKSVLKITSVSVSVVTGGWSIYINKIIKIRNIHIAKLYI